MIVDFRKSSPSPTLTVIKGSNIELVDRYKYLGTAIDSKLGFELHVDAVCNVVQQRLFFLRKINSFNVCATMMTLFY